MTIYATYPIAAQMNSEWPLFAAGVLVGAMVVALPLWRDRPRWSSILAAWILSCGIVVVTNFRDATFFRLVLFITAAATTAVWLAAFWIDSTVAHFFNFPSSLIANRKVHFAKISSAIVAFGLAAMTIDGILNFLPLNWGVQEVEPYQNGLLLVGAGSLVVGVVYAVGVSACKRKGIVATRKVPGPKFTSLTNKARRDPRKGAVGNLVDIFYRAASIVEICFSNAMSVAWYSITVISVAIYEMAASFAAIIAEMARILARSAVSAVRYSAIPVIGIGFASWLTLRASQNNLQYLVRGNSDSLLNAVALELIAIASLTLTWIAVSTQPVRRSVYSAVLSVLNSAPYLLFYIWVGFALVYFIGLIPGIRIHVHTVGIGLTVLLLILLAVGLIRKKIR
ncbi:hypothetical protein [Streptomyces inhibens]|uniref:hypothetical protein n=1 Tax=Streptomyces inhibens TaxID=2293571 RepID=UPI001EE72DC8|nr:hypothetical protein [Streptomyces inhibens]UKY49911.1 hypothetical protein KI385_14510 [Streptomyces inhibens]